MVASGRLSLAWMMIVHLITTEAFSNLSRTRIPKLFRLLGSSSSPSKAQHSRATQYRSRPTKSKSTGGLRRLPVVKSPDEILNRAMKQMRYILPDISIQNAKLRTRKYGAEQLNAFTLGLCLPLRDIVQGYKVEFQRLHPFERTVADLTAQANQRRDGVTLNTVLRDIDEARKQINKEGKQCIAEIKAAATARDSDLANQAAVNTMSRSFSFLASESVNNLLALQRSLRSAPIVELDAPSVVLVGAPNVGKSSIVREISSATPEVNNYPFTTRGMTLGHVQVFWTADHQIARAKVPELSSRPTDTPTTADYAYTQLCQIMDTPGLLARPDEERNQMEKLTLAAMQHLPTAVVFVMDLSGSAGSKCSSIEDQLQLRREMRKRFPKRPWIDVVSKVDLEVKADALDELEKILCGTPYILLSLKSGAGIDELKTQVLRMLGEVRVVLDAMAAAEVNADETESHDNTG